MIHRGDEIEVFAFEEEFLSSLAAVLRRDNQWSVIHNEGELVVTAGEATLIGTISSHRLG